MIDRFFGVTASGSNLRTEIIAGATTYLTMAYIVFVNPVILAESGMDKGACLSRPALPPRSPRC